MLRESRNVAWYLLCAAEYVSQSILGQEDPLSRHGRIRLELFELSGNDRLAASVYRNSVMVSQLMLILFRERSVQMESPDIKVTSRLYLFHMSQMIRETSTSKLKDARSQRREAGLGGRGRASRNRTRKLKIADVPKLIASTGWIFLDQC